MSKIVYSPDKPNDCRYCHFWKNNKTGCCLGEENCYYLWVVTEDITRQPDQPWRADKTTPVILLSYCKAADTPIQKADGKLTILTMPVLPKTLRDAVLSHIR